VATVRTERGATLPEVLVGAALMAGLLLVGARLVERSVAVVGRVGREARGASTEAIRAQLRRDVQEARTVLSVAVSWSSGPLLLARDGGGTVEVAHEGDAVRRRVRDGAGEIRSDRVLVRGVTGWWWRLEAARIVDVRVTVLVHDGPPPEAGALPPWRRTETVRYALRTPPGGAWW
jgi:hypothetical protein